MNMKIEIFNREPEAINNKQIKIFRTEFRYSLDKLNSGMEITKSRVSELENR